MRIERGEIRIDNVATLVDSRTCRAWHVSLDSKYAEILAYSPDEVLLISGTRTTNLDPARRGHPTCLVIDLPLDWQVIADCARYTCRVVGYKPRLVR